MGWTPVVEGDGKATAAEDGLDIERIAREENVDVRLLKAMRQIESSGGKNIKTSHKGARGDMQIIPDTFKRFAKPGEMIDNREHNLRVGARYLKFLSDRYKGDPYKIGAAYLSGEGNVDDYGVIDDGIDDGRTRPSQHGENLRKAYEALSGGGAETPQASAGNGWKGLDLWTRGAESPAPGNMSGEIGVVDAAGKGLKRAMVDLAEAVNIGGQFIANRIDSKSADEFFKAGAEFWADVGKQYDPPPELQGNILDHPELLGKASWWAYNVANIVPSVAATIVPALGTYGLMARGPAAIARLARIGAAVSGGAVGGSLEGVQTYDELRKRGAPESEAAVAGTLMALASAGLNAISLDVFMGKSTSLLKKFLVSGSTEALTEWLEEPTEGAILSNTSVAKPEDDPISRAREGVNVIPPSFLVGGATGAAGGRRAERDEKGGKKEGDKPASPPPAQGENKTAAPMPAPDIVPEDAESLLSLETPPAVTTAARETLPGGMAAPDGGMPAVIRSNRQEFERTENPTEQPDALAGVGRPQPTQWEQDGLRYEVRQITPALWATYIKPNSISGVETFEEYRQRYPDITHIRLASRDDGMSWQRARAPFIGTYDDLTVGIGATVDESGMPAVVRSNRSMPKVPDVIPEQMAQAADRAAEESAAVAPSEPGDGGPTEAPAPQAPEPDSSVEAGAHQAATSPNNDLPEPTDGQKEAGNYPKGHVRVGGLEISIENPEGSVRTNKPSSPVKWETTMQHHYGYIRGTVGNDKDHIDAFVKPGTPEDFSGTVFVVDQKDPTTGKFDEHKVMIGFDSLEEAKAAYHANYAKDWNGLKTISAVPMEEFKQWLAEGDTTAEFYAWKGKEAPIKNAEDAALAQWKKDVAALAERHGMTPGKHESNKSTYYRSSKDGSFVSIRATRQGIHVAAVSTYETGAGKSSVGSDRTFADIGEAEKFLLERLEVLAEHFTKDEKEGEQKPADSPKKERTDPQAIRKKLEKIAERLGLQVFKAPSGWHATGASLDIPDVDVDVSAWGAVSPNHVFAHELGHAVMQRRGVGYGGFPVSEMKKRIDNWDDLVAASKAFRPAVHNHANERVRRHARKPDEILADSIASVLIGDNDIELIRSWMKSAGATERDLGLVDAPAETKKEPAPAPESDDLDAMFDNLLADELAKDEKASGEGDRAKLLNELRDKMTALMQRAIDAGNAKLAGQINSFAVGMSPFDKLLTREWVDGVLAEREKMVSAAEKKAEKSKAKPSKDEYAAAMERLDSAPEGATIFYQGVTYTKGAMLWEPPIGKNGERGQPLASSFFASHGVRNFSAPAKSSGRTWENSLEIVSTGFDDGSYMVREKNGRNDGSHQNFARFSLNDKGRPVKIEHFYDHSKDPVQAFIESWAKSRSAPANSGKASSDGKRAPKTSRAQKDRSNKGKEWTEIGKNAIGQTLYEDDNGVRSYIENGVRVTETVGIIPGRGIVVDKSARGTAFSLVEEGVAADRTAGEAAASAVQNTAAGLSSAIDGLGALFGGEGKLSSGLSFDEETYKKAKPLFLQAIAHLKTAAADIREAMRTIIRMVLDKFGPKAASNMKPYVVRFVEDVREGKVDVSGKEGGDESADSNRPEPVDSSDSEGSGDGSQSDNPGGRPGGSGDATGSDQVLGGKPPGYGSKTGAGDGEQSGTGSDASNAPGGRGKPAGGNVLNGRKGKGGAGLDADGAGRGGVTDSPEPPKQPTLGNYHIEDPEALVGGTPKVRFERNKAAIEAYRRVLDENRDPTQEERDVIARYIGWGSFGQELFNGTWEQPKPKDGWQAADQWLRAHMGESEWKSAQRSIINAHYTDPPTVNAMWNMVRMMGFKGGRVLEPSVGIGNFFGMMPKDLKEASTLAGIELDELTGGMAKMLYPDANIQIKGFQDSATADNFYDLVIGNWPFYKDGPSDRRYRLIAPSLHDYFFLKAVDQVRPGGIVIGITSSGTMDKAGKLTRLALAKNAELLAAFRLPSGAFEKYAGTAVVTDILILRKREKPDLNPENAGWIELQEIPTPSGQTIRVNEYYVRNPDRVLGTLNFGSGTTRGRPGMIVDRPDDLMERLAVLEQFVPPGAFRPWNAGKEINYIANNTKDRENSVTLGADNGLYVVSGEYLAPLHEVVDYRVKDSKKTKSREAEIRALIDIRKKYGALIDAELSGAENTESIRKSLKAAHKAFVSENGAMNDSYGLSLLRKVGDPYWASISALEIKTPKGFTAARILSEATMRTKKSIDKPTVRDAYVMARNASLFIDMDRIAETAGTTVEKAKAELLGSGAVFETPSGNFEPRDIYLSGNVRRKLAEAKDALENGNKNMEPNVAALQAVIPEDIPYYQIEAKLGAPWVAPSYYQQFLADLLNLTEAQRDSLSIKFRLGSWKLKIADEIVMKPEARGKWGTSDIIFTSIASAAFNNTKIVIRGRDSDGREYVKERETQLANEKAAALREEFGAWIWKDFDRKMKLERDYNEVFNSEADPQFDGSFLTLEGMALQRGDSQFNLRSHQINAIWRGIANRRGLYAHEVGTGKTYTMGGLAIESRRYGIARKPLILAHNANSKSVTREIQEMYPGARLLYLGGVDSKTMPVAMRQIANDDWDAVVIPHSKISMFGFRKETLMRMAQEEILALEMEAQEAAAEKGIELTVADMDNIDDPKVSGKIRDATAKELVKARNSVIRRIEDMAEKASKEDSIPFEELGIDMVIVDEAHEFGKPPLATKMQLRGLNKSSSQRSLSLMFLTSYVREINGGPGVHLFTGTPITNTLNEIFNHQRYVEMDIMKRDGVSDWDSWFNTFADSSTDVELNAAGQYEPVTRLASFVNVAELRRMIGSYTDIVFADDMPEFAPRSTEDGKTLQSENLTPEELDFLVNGQSENPIGRPYKKIVNDVGAMSPEQEDILRRLQALATEFKNASGRARYEMMRSGHPASPVLVETNAANAAMDARLYDKYAPDFEGSKVNRAVRNVLKHYNEHPLATQVIFLERGYSDVSIRKKKDKSGNVTTTRVEKFNLVNDIIGKLVSGGIKPEEIAVVSGGVTDEQKKQIADDMNSGKRRVVIGMTSTLGVGVNMQRNLRAMHHIDAPWRPGDLEQRNGRGHRQGNHWNTVLEYRYITDRLDGRRWQVLAVKQRFITAFLKADKSVRVIEGDAASMDESDGDILESLSEAAGDPRILLLNKYKQDVERLEAKARTHDFGRADSRHRLRMMQEELKYAEKRKANLDADAATVESLKKRDFEAKVGDTPVTTRKDFDEKLESLFDGMDVSSSRDYVPIGSIYGIPLKGMVTADRFGANVAKRYHVIIVMNGEYAASPSAQSIEGAMRGIPKRARDESEKIEETKRSIPAIEEAITAPFPRAADLEKKRQLFAQVEADLDLNPVPPPPWLRHGAPAGTEIFVGGVRYPVEGHQYAQDGFFVIVTTDDGPRRVWYRYVADEAGQAVYSEQKFEAPPKAERQLKKGDVVILKSDHTYWNVVTAPYEEQIDGGQKALMVNIENVEDGKVRKSRVGDLTLDNSAALMAAKVKDLDVTAEQARRARKTAGLPESDVSESDMAYLEKMGTAFSAIERAAPDGWSSVEGGPDQGYNGPIPTKEVASDDGNKAAFSYIEQAVQQRWKDFPSGALQRVAPDVGRLSHSAPARARDLEAAQRIAESFGHELIWFDNAAGDIFNFGGFVVGADESRIYSNIRNGRPHTFVVGHELLHQMRRHRPDLYKEFVAAVKPLLKNRDDHTHPFAMGDDKLLEELLADFTGWNMMRRGFWRDMAAQDRSRFRRIADYVLAFLNDIVLRFSGNVPNMGRFFTDVQSAQTALIDALSQYQNPSGRAQDGGGGLSFAAFDNGNGAPPSEGRVALGFRERAQRVLDRMKMEADPFAFLPKKEDLLRIRYRLLGKIASFDEVAADIRHIFGNASEESQVAAYKYMITPDADKDMIPDPGVATMAERVKRLIESVGDAMVARGILSPEAREAHRGRYLPQVYLKFLLGDQNWRALGAGKKISNQGYLKQRKLDRRVGPDGEVHVYDAQTGKPLDDEFLNAVLGPVTDPGFLSSMAIVRPLRDMAILDYLDMISRNAAWVLPKSIIEWRGKRVSAHWAKTEAERLRRQSRHQDEPDRTNALKIADDLDRLADEALGEIEGGEHADYKQIPNTARYGRLRGIHVRREIYDDLMGVHDFLPDDAGWAMSLLGYGGVGTRMTQLWKAGKVSLNPPAQIRNFVSNMVLLQLSGVPMHRIPGLFVRALRQILNYSEWRQGAGQLTPEQRRQVKHYLIALKYGVTESTFQAQELFQMQRDLLEIEKRAGKLTPLSQMKLFGGMLLDRASHYYQMTEALGKTMKIMDEMERNGTDEAAAALAAQEALFDYSLVSKNVRYLRNAPLGMPFLTFAVKVLPQLATVARHHPERFVPWVALAYGLPALVASAFDVDDDDLEKLKKAMPEWLQDRGHAYLMPWKDDSGRWQVLDLGYFFPWTTWTEPVRALSTGEPGKAVQALGMFSGPVSDLIVAMMTGRDSFTGREITQKGDPPKRQFLQMVNYMWSMAMPPIVTDHGALGHGIRAATGDTNRFGDPLSTPGQAALRAVGVNLYPMHPEQSRMQNMQRMMREINDTNVRLKQQLSNRALSESQRQSLVQEYMAEIRRRQEKLMEYKEQSEIHPNLRTQ